MHKESEGVILERFSAPLGDGDDDDFSEVLSHCESEFDGGVGREVGVEDVELVGDFEHLPAAVSDGEEGGFGLGGSARRSAVVLDGGAEDVFVGEDVLDVPVAPADDELALGFGNAGDGGC